MKAEYLRRGVADTVVTTVLDGIPQRVLRTELVERLLRAGAAARLGRSLRHAVAFRRMSGIAWSDLVREGLAMRRNHDLGWSQVLMAANTPVLLSAGLVDGDTTKGTLASGQVAGLIDDLPSCRELILRIMTEADQTLRRLESGTQPVAAAGATGTAGA